MTIDHKLVPKNSHKRTILTDKRERDSFVIKCKKVVVKTVSIKLAVPLNIWREPFPKTNLQNMFSTLSKNLVFLPILK